MALKPRVNRWQRSVRNLMKIRSARCETYLLLARIDPVATSPGTDLIASDRLRAWGQGSRRRKLIIDTRFTLVLTSEIGTVDLESLCLARPRDSYLSQSF